MKKILIDHSCHETRVAVLRDKLLIGLDTESNDSPTQKGNIYLGVIKEIKDSLQAASVEYLPGQCGFLSFAEIPVQYFDIKEDIKKSVLNTGQNADLYKKFNITEVIKEGMQIYVQVIKEKRYSKTATLSGYIRIVSRYCVLMPFAYGVSFSKKIIDENKITDIETAICKDLEKNKLGLSIRGYAQSVATQTIKHDYEYVLSLWKGIVLGAKNVNGPCVLRSEHKLVKRIIRDSYDSAADCIIVNDQNECREIEDYAKNILRIENFSVQFHDDNQNIFAAYKAEDQIADLYQQNVKLRSGGYLIIATTEALTAVDINSGRMNKETSIEETAYRTNMEAAAEIARQIELRGISGIVVIDFIDMKNSKYISSVEKVLADSFKRYHARVHIVPMNKFGLIAFSKQRTKNNLIEANTTKCVNCNGTGRMINNEYYATQIFRQISSSARGEKIVVSAIPELASYLFNAKRRQIQQIEEEHQMQIDIEIGHFDIGKAFEIKLDSIKPQGVASLHQKEANKVIAVNSSVDTENNKSLQKPIKTWVGSWIKKIISLQ